MFDIGWGELVVIGVVALIAIGPKELPGVLRTLGQAMAKVRRMAAEFQGQFNEAMREAEMADLKQTVEDTASSFTNFDPLADTKKDIEKVFEDQPPADTAPPAPDMPVSIEPAAALSRIEVPLPEPLPSLTSADFTPPAPVPMTPVAEVEPAATAAPKKRARSGAKKGAT